MNQSGFRRAVSHANGPEGLQFKKVAGGYEFDIPPLNSLTPFFTIEGKDTGPTKRIKAVLHVVVQGQSYVAGRVPESVEVTAVNARFKIELKKLSLADRRSLALALVTNGRVDAHTLVAVYSLATGDRAMAMEHLASAGEVPAKVRALFE